MESKIDSSLQQPHAWYPNYGTYEDLSKVNPSTYKLLHCSGIMDDANLIMLPFTQQIRIYGPWCVKQSVNCELNNLALPTWKLKMP